MPLSCPLCKKQPPHFLQEEERMPWALDTADSQKFLQVLRELYTSRRWHQELRAGCQSCKTHHPFLCLCMSDPSKATLRPWAVLQPEARQSDCSWQYQSSMHPPAAWEHQQEWPRCWPRLAQTLMQPLHPCSPPTKKGSRRQACPGKEQTR